MLQHHLPHIIDYNDILIHNTFLKSFNIMVKQEKIARYTKIFSDFVGKKLNTII